ncbi:MAG: 6-phosphogluconolactonase [Candidatus Diapherotrites archaeon]|uniref:6-phosphogluconolactonase n=1 Tax=Candidatus Iainarchaeum sp. TaxID=3101447 RepID=A0A8T3YJL0_9ARCH|nr:6-phosphogluconolactonase [Candidatus Diapherotrites archaeon]
MRFGEEHAARDFRCAIGGNAANSAMALSGLGIDVSLVSAIGKDAFTPFLRRELSKGGVRQVLSRLDSPNGVSTIFVRAGGERAIISHKGCLLGLDSRMVSRSLLPRISRGDIVLFGGYFHLPGMRKGFTGLLKAIRRKGAIACLDACFDEYGTWKARHFARHIDYFFLNELELSRITRSGKNTRAGVERLLSWGAGNVILKRGRRGAEFHSASGHAYAKACNVRAINATGAGDFFNAGFLYGLLRGFSPENCLLCGNFVAGQKISRQDYFIPRKKTLADFLAKRSLAGIVRVKDYRAVSRAAFDAVAGALREKPSSVLSLAAGKTPVGAYRMLARAFRLGNVDFSKASFLELDEYISRGGFPRERFAGILAKELIGKVNFRHGNVFLFSGDAAKARAECRQAEHLAWRRGIDLLLLGIGENGHIAFNEPGSPFSSGTRVVRISRSALRSRGGKPSGHHDANAVTLGMRTIMSARKIVLIAAGREKARAIVRAFGKRPGQNVPASILQMHGNATVIVDRAAGRLLAGARMD